MENQHQTLCSPMLQHVYVPLYTPTHRTVVVVSILLRDFCATTRTHHKHDKQVTSIMQPKHKINVQRVYISTLCVGPTFPHTDPSLCCTIINVSQSNDTTKHHMPLLPTDDPLSGCELLPHLSFFPKTLFLTRSSIIVRWRLLLATASPDLCCAFLPSTTVPRSASRCSPRLPIGERTQGVFRTCVSLAEAMCGSLVGDLEHAR